MDCAIPAIVVVMALVMLATVSAGGPVAGVVTGVAAGGEVVMTPQSRYEGLGGKYTCPIVILRFTKAGVMPFAMMLFIVSVRDFFVRRFGG